MSEQVHSMFSAIAPRYDTANDVLSFGIHHVWRREAVRRSMVKPGDSVLDCATGTGDLALAFKRAVGEGGRVLGTDFNAAMLSFAPEKAKQQGLDVTFEVADATALPYEAATFDVASIAFGIRNVDDPSLCLRELSRVVKAHGRVVVLEFGQPSGVFGAMFRLYSKWIMPRLGQLLTGNKSAYEYLPKTAAAFPAGPKFVAMMQDTGRFLEVTATPLLAGLAYIYVGVVSPASR